MTFPVPVVEPPIRLSVALFENLHAMLSVAERVAAGDVGPDVVPGDEVEAGVDAADQDAVAVIPGDDVTPCGERAANRVSGRARVDQDALSGVLKRRRPGGIGADSIRGDEVRRRSRRANHDCRAGVAGQQIPFTRGRSTDRVVVRAEIDQHAAERVRYRGRACRIGPDVVTAQHVVRCRAPADDDATPGVRGDDVSSACSRATDRVRAAVRDEHAGATVRQSRGAVCRKTDVVALNDVPVGAAAVDVDPSTSVPRNDVARGGGRAAETVRRAGDLNAGPAIRSRRRAGGVGADIAAFDDTVGPLHHDAGDQRTGAARTEAIDDQTADGGVVRGDRQTVAVAAGACPLISMSGVPAEPRLRRTVDGQRIGDGRERRQRRDRLKTATADREGDRVGAGNRVRVQNRLPQRSRPAVIRVVDRPERSPRRSRTPRTPTCCSPDRSPSR